MLLEPRTNGQSVQSSMWSVDEWKAAINESQRNFLRDTEVVVTHQGFRGDTNTGIGVVPGTEAVGLPQGTISVERVAWITFDTQNPAQVEAVNELPRDDAWTLDIGDSGWEADQQPAPTEYTESIPAPLTIYLSHPPSDIGSIDLMSISLPAALSNTGVAIGVPDVFAQYLVYGALAILLSKSGEAFDPVRSDYCLARYTEGVALAKHLLDMPFAIQGGST
jgi:hypothetical protein